MGALSYGMYRELNELFPVSLAGGAAGCLLVGCSATVLLRLSWWRALPAALPPPPTTCNLPACRPRPHTIDAQGMKPVLRWDAQVARVTHEANRTLAVVELPSSGGRYPAPTWLQGEPSDAEQEEGLSAAPAAAIPVPPAYQALVHGKPFGAVPLGEGRQVRCWCAAGVPCGDSASRQALQPSAGARHSPTHPPTHPPSPHPQIHLDVTGATPAVKAGDHVCLLCDQHTVYDLAEVSTTLERG